MAILDLNQNDLIFLSTHHLDTSKEVLSQMAFPFMRRSSKYKGESISNQPNLFPVEIHLFFFDVIAL